MQSQKGVTSDHATGADPQGRQKLHKGMRAGQWWSYKTYIY